MYHKRYQAMPPMPVDDELRARLGDAEDALVERKESPHLEAVKEAASGLANTLAEGTTGVVFIGVKNNGTPTGKLGDVDAVLKKVRGYLSQCYPPLPYQLHALQANGADVVAIVVSPSRDRPHFTGKAYVRKGAETIEASQDAIGQLLDQRNSLVAALTPYVGEKITVFEARQMSTGAAIWDGKHRDATLVAVNPHFVRVKITGETADRAISLRRIDLEWNYWTTPNRPTLRVSV